MAILFCALKLHFFGIFSSVIVVLLTMHIAAHLIKIPPNHPIILVISILVILIGLIFAIFVWIKRRPVNEFIENEFTNIKQISEDLHIELFEYFYTQIDLNGDINDSYNRAKEKLLTQSPEGQKPFLVAFFSRLEHFVEMNSYLRGEEFHLIMNMQASDQPRWGAKHLRVTVS